MNLSPRQQRIVGRACVLGSIVIALVLATIKPLPTVPAVATGLLFWSGVVLLLPRTTKR